MGKTVGSVAFAAVLAGVLVWSRMNRRGENEAAILQQMEEMVSKIDVYPANQEYLDKLLKEEHRGAFDAAYSMGGRRKGAKFDWSKYTTTLFDGMCKECARDKKPEVAKSLRQLEQIMAAALAAEEKEGK